MKKDSKVRLFEVMGRLDKTFKPKLNEDFEFNNTENSMSALPSGEETPAEKTPEEKLEELTAKVDELYAMLHGEESEAPSDETGEESTENLQEWNFDKKKGDKFKKEENKESKEHEESETPEEEKEKHAEKKEIDETKPKIPVAAIAKVGK